MATSAERSLFYDRLSTFKKIAAIKHPSDIEKVIKYKNRISAVFLMTGNITSVKGYADYLKKEGLPVFIHIEKIGGLSLDLEGLDFIANYVKALGIVTTKPGLIAKAKRYSLMTIQRVFMIDTEVYNYVVDTISQDGADIIEIMPSRLPHIIQAITKQFTSPIITGGLLTEEAHAREAIQCGAAAVTTSNRGIWKADLSL